MQQGKPQTGPRQVRWIAGLSHANGAVRCAQVVGMGEVEWC